MLNFQQQYPRKVKRICHKCECIYTYSVKDTHDFFTSVIRTHDMCDKFIKRVLVMRSYPRPLISLSTTLCCEKKNVEETSSCS